MTPTGIDRFEQKLWAQLRPLLDDRVAATPPPTPTPTSTARAPSDAPPPRWSRWVATAAVVALVVAAVGLVGVGRRGDDAAVFVQPLDGGRVRLPLDTTAYTGGVEQARTELELLGLDVRVERPTGSPSAVDAFVAVDVGEDAPGVEIDDPSSYATVTIDPEVYRGVVRLIVPRAPAPGDLPQWAGSAFAVGEPLEGVACGRWPVTSRRLAAAADARGVDVHWQTITSVGRDPEAGTLRSFTVDASQGRVDGRVVDAQVATTGMGNPPGTVSVMVLPDDVPAPSILRRPTRPPDVVRDCGG